MIKTPHKGIQGEVGRSHEVIVEGRLEFAKGDLPFPVIRTLL